MTQLSNHITSLVNAANAFLNDNVSVTTEIVKRTKVHAPIGKGPRMSPTIVVRKLANRRQACFETPLGLGMAKHSMSPMQTEIPSGIGFAPGNLMWRRRECVGMVMTVALLVSDICCCV
ncbi:hypothetical protein L1987_65507 [Smallanthus sonchifolius]|uniref:Uncharacterized protein n=1 Tax=Smallanthus sonchifolius TaxID=185202 RepID=A0ACB9BUQ3_9ASTR|nr:hypothetical protein L1987_65507 [Smallanthus sonchifolius]